MSARRFRLYVVNLGDESHLCRATTRGQAMQTVARDMIRCRVAEPEDIIRLANASGAGLRVAQQPEREELPEGVKRGPGRPPASAYAQHPAAEPASSEAA
jgi:hypothetical protein